MAGKPKPFFPQRIDTLEGAEEEAVEFIRQHCPPEGYYIGFSGGKDSIVTLDLVKRSGVLFTAYYSFTGIDPPEVVHFIKDNYPDVVWLKPSMTFWQGVVKKNPPLRMRRWCCDVLKKNPGKLIPLKSRIMGVRAEESFKRKQRGRVSYYKKQNETCYHPIFWWSSREIWDYIKKYKLKYPCLYDEGHARIGCIICPFLSGAQLKRSQQRWPKYWQTMRKYLKLNWEIHKDKLIEMNFTEDEFVNHWPKWKSKEERNHKGGFNIKSFINKGKLI